jgi:hypothetical protein
LVIVVAGPEAMKFGGWQRLNVEYAGRIGNPISCFSALRRYRFIELILGN